MTSPARDRRTRQPVVERGLRWRSDKPESRTRTQMVGCADTSGVDMADWPERDLDPSKGLRIGTWNLDRDRPLWRQPHQADHVRNQADLWLLTEVPASWQFGTANSSFSGSRPGEDDQYWSTIICRWHVEPIDTTHPSLAMARIDHPAEPFLVAASVFPWRGAAEFWPTGDGDTFAERCVNTLEAHSAEICEARCGLPVVWGGDFNQALSGRDYVGSDAGREALSRAFKHIGSRAVTIESDGQVTPHQSIDHIAVPKAWRSEDVEVQRPQSDGRFLSDHPSYVVAVERMAVSDRVFLAAHVVGRGDGRPSQRQSG
jgi:Endonuclease/Exonuclease/phosphatase family